MSGSCKLAAMVAIASAMTTKSFQLRAPAHSIHARQTRHNTPRRVAFHPSESNTDTSRRASIVCNVAEGFDAPFLSSASLLASDVVDFAVSNFGIEVQSLTSGALCGMGDIVAQTQENNENDNGETQLPPRMIDRFNLDRTGRSILKGLGGGLIWYQWYSMADVMSEELVTSLLQLPSDAMMHTPATTVSSILLEQFIACPIIFALWDLPLPSLLDGTDPRAIPAKVKSKIGKLLWENSKVWTLVNIILYNIPLEWRVFAMNIADLYWQSIYSGIALKDNASSSEVKQKS